MRQAVVAAALIAVATSGIASALAAGRQAKPSRQEYATRILAAPSSGDERAFQTHFHQDAQGLSDRLFDALRKVLGGDAPRLNFVGDSDESTPNGFSANLRDRPGYPVGTINVDPLATFGLIDDESGDHDRAVNAMPHEMMHLRQIAAVLADTAQAEGGAQAFANIVSPVAAQLAHTHYGGFTGQFDGPYADYVKQANARGRDWILGGQMGKPPVAWP